MVTQRIANPYIFNRSTHFSFKSSRKRVYCS